MRISVLTVITGVFLKRVTIFPMRPCEWRGNARVAEKNISYDLNLSSHTNLSDQGIMSFIFWTNDNLQFGVGKKYFLLRWKLCYTTMQKSV